MENEDVQQRHVLAAALREHLKKQPGTQVTKAKRLKISQPRLSDLMRNRVDKFSFDSLVALCFRAGLQVSVNAQSVLVMPSGGQRIKNVDGDSPFPVDPSELSRFDSIAATKLFRRILSCEVLAAGLSPKDVVVSHNTTAPDDGIDAMVDGVPIANGFLSKGGNRFQIKTGNSFKPWQPSQLKKELFGSSTARPSKKALSSAVTDCLDQNGKYTIVSFGHDLLPAQVVKSQRELTKILQACGYARPQVQIVGQGQIAAEIERYPSMYLDLFGFDDDFFLSVRSWSNQSLMQVELSLGDQQEAFINEVRSILLENLAAHIRVIGEPGIGKTRLVLEAISIDELAPTVVYAPTGEDFQRSRLFKQILRSEQAYPLTLVVDDCDEKDRASIWAALRNRPAVKLITIDHGIERSSDSTMRVLECPSLPIEQVARIIGGYIGDNAIETRNWAEICDGSPRVAHAVGANLKNNPEDILRPPSSIAIWDRYVTGYGKIDSATANEYQLVLRHIALFAKFGFEPPVSEEGKFIAGLVQNADPNITYAKFQSIVQHFRERRILQGRHTLFLVPKALHVYLWVEYWKNHGRDFDFVEFFRHVPEGMQDWFLSLFAYAHDTAPALSVVKNILAPDGPYADKSFVRSEIAARLLRYLAEADRHSALACIERVYGSWTHKELYSWQQGRQDIVWALEKIAVWDDCFERAVKVLTLMALAENASNSNNSRGTLADLFSIGLGWAATQAAPPRRFPILKRLVCSRDAAERDLGLELAGKWLSTYGGSRTIGPEHQGLRPTLQFWRPETYGEIYDAWRSVWGLLRSEIDGSEGTRRQQLIEVLVESANGLLLHQNLSHEILDTLFEIASIDGIDNKKLVEFVIRFMRIDRDGAPDEIVKRVEDLDAVLTGSSFWDRVTRYVLNSNWDEDYTVDGEDVTESDEPKKWVDSLAEELMISPDSFSQYAHRLMRSSGHRLPRLGVVSGRKAKDRAFDEAILDALRDDHTDINAEFAAGYFSGIRELDRNRWEALMLSILTDNRNLDFAVDCVRRSGLSDNIIKALEKLYLDDLIDARSFDRYAFRFETEAISEPCVISLIEALLDYPKDLSANAATELLYEYYLESNTKKPLPFELTKRCLATSSQDGKFRNPMFDLCWGRLAERFLEQYPDESVPLLRSLLASGKLIGHGRGRAIGIAERIIAEKPHESWGVISDVLDSSGTRRYDLTYWLTGSLSEVIGKAPPPSSKLIPEDVVRWVKENPENRLGRAIALLPRTLDEDQGGALTKTFIEEFDDDEGVAGALAAHFWAGSWSGPESNYLESKRTAARKWLAETDSAPVQAWLSTFITQLGSDIETARIREEREF